MAKTKKMTETPIVSVLSSDYKLLVTDNGGKVSRYDGNVGAGKMVSSKGEIFNSYSGIYTNIAEGVFSHAEGWNTKALKNQAHAEGETTRAVSPNSHAEGKETVAGNADNINISCCHAEGWKTTASGFNAHSEGAETVASGDTSHASGGKTIASGNYSSTFGFGTHAKNYCQFAIGVFNKADGTITSDRLDVNKPALSIGNGTQSSRGDAFRVLFGGSTQADGAYTTPAADYAEMFEWADGNPQNEDRVGFFVEIDGEKVRKATSKSKNIVGVVSANPAIIGDNPLRWNGEYATDEWGRRLTEEVVTEYEEPINENGVFRMIKKTRVDIVFKRSSDFRNDEEYTERTERKEWSAIGMLGKLLIRQDGSLKVGSYCTSNNEGIATDAKSGYYVMKVVSPTQALILVK